MRAVRKVERAEQIERVRSVLLEPFGLAAAPGDVPDSLWDEVIAAAGEHRVLGALRRGTAIEQPGLPESVLGPVRAEYFSALTRHLKYIELLGRLVPLFAGRGVRWAVVKGPVLAELSYPAVDLRSYTDLDLLVHPADFEVAVTVLEALGGEVYERNWSLMARMERGELAIVLPGGLYVDLHWHLLIDPEQRRHVTLDTVQLLERARTVDLSGLGVPALDPIDAFTHLAVHAVLAGAHRLRWSLDLHYAAAHLRHPGEAAVVRRLHSARAETFVHVMAGRAARLLGVESDWPIGGPPDAWARAIGAYDAIRKPERWFGQAASGRLLLASTRPGPIASGRALGSTIVTAAHEFTDNPAHRWRRGRAGNGRAGEPPDGEPTVSPILRTDPAADGRRRFFEMTRTTTGSTP